MVGRKVTILLGLLMIVLLSACGPQSGNSPALLANKINGSQAPTATSTSQIIIPQQVAHSTPTAQPNMVRSAASLQPTATIQPTPTTSATQPPTSTVTIPSGGSGSSPYGAPPAITSAEITLTQQLFALINSDRAARGLYPFVWNTTLAAGARQHAWDMVHCGFSHTCPSGLDQCVRIEDEGFQGVSDCGECIGLAGPYPTAWGGVYNVQESMINEPPTGWHRIHLTSTTLHRVGVGLYVDSRGWIWFVEDMVS